MFNITNPQSPSIPSTHPSHLLPPSPTLPITMRPRLRRRPAPFVNLTGDLLQLFLLLLAQRHLLVVLHLSSRVFLGTVSRDPHGTSSPGHSGRCSTIRSFDPCESMCVDETQVVYTLDVVATAGKRIKPSTVRLFHWHGIGSMDMIRPDSSS